MASRKIPDSTMAKLEEEVGEDLRKSAGVVKDIFKVVLGISNVGKEDAPRVGTSERLRVDEDDGNTITVSGTVSGSSCLTCGGKGMLGKRGHEIPCPMCSRACSTCGGTGKLGNSGHEIDCPHCQ